ncbi:nucleoside-diphosphate kinase [Microbacterium sp. DT81.1]|uniref:nucleoside-diphosphate kinase n=1 Tax=Microbacterium sp. DT81.1 TaxID=3393413 RepID=UPI003CF59ECD
MTSSREEPIRYHRDTYYLESVQQLGADAWPFAERHGLLLLKPDAIVARGVEPTLDWLATNGYRVVAAREMAVDRLRARALWYHNWHIASPERRTIADLMVELSPSLLLVVTDDRSGPVAPRLTEGKGPTAPKDRRLGELRHLLGGSTYLLNFVHTSDTAAEVLRELGVYFGARDRLAVVHDALQGLDREADARRIAANLYESAPEQSFDLDVAKSALIEQLNASNLRPDSQGTEWATALRDAWHQGTPLDPWPTIVVGASVLPMRIPPPRPIDHDVDLDEGAQDS